MSTAPTCVGEGLHRRIVEYVQTVRRDTRRQLREQFLLEVSRDHAGALARERQHCGAAHALAGGSHQRRLALQTPRHHSSAAGPAA